MVADRPSEHVRAPTEVAQLGGAAAMLAYALLACAWVRSPRPVTDASTPFEFTISVKQQNLDELKRIALAVSTPGNPSYGQHLEQAAIDALTAPDAADMSAVTGWLTDANIPHTVHRENVRVSTTVAAAEALLSTTVFTFTEKASGNTRLRASEYTLPPRVAAATAAVFNLRGLPLPPTAHLFAAAAKPRRCCG